ncbi:T-DNA border endonuclease VirD1 [Gemmobacter caeni]|nr:T-DNA border endonuclease VirD1 [Gemmobacter caeni]
MRSVVKYDAHGKDRNSAGVARNAADPVPRKSAGRGRPRSADRGQVVSCRLPAEELRAFDALCVQLGAKSRSDGVRSVVRMASGFLEFSREDSARLEEIRYELAKIGTNVNQIALAANRGRAPMVRAQWATVEELRRSLPMVAKTLSQIIAERRRQGVALFLKFAEGQAGARRG